MMSRPRPGLRVRREQQPADDPVMHGERPTRSALFEALGFTIMVETNDERVERAAGQVFKPLCDTNEIPEPEFVIRLLVHDVREADSWRPVQPVFRAQGRYFYMAASSATVVTGDTEAGFAFGFISDKQADHTEHLRSTLLQSPFLWTITDQSLSAVHCAVISLNGTSILIRGAPNAGKTTLAYAALCEGFSLLCEDVAFAFGAEDGSIELRGMPWLLYLLPDTTRFFPELANVPEVERFNEETKLALDVASRFPGQAIETASIGPSVFVNRCPNGDNRLVPMDVGEARDWLAATQIPYERAESDGYDIWGAMLAQPVYRFDVGPDPRAAARVLKDLCQG